MMLFPIVVMMSSNMENVAPQVLRSVLKQAQSLVQEKMEGIQVVLNDNDMTDIQVGLLIKLYLNNKCQCYVSVKDNLHFN